MSANLDVQPDREEPFPLLGYLLLNAVVWVFCLGMVFVVRLLLNDLTGVLFFFVALPVGFAVVSVFDAIYDRATISSRPAPPPEEPSETEQADES